MKFLLRVLIILSLTMQVLIAAENDKASDKDTENADGTEVTNAVSAPPIEPKELRRDRALAEQLTDSEAKWIKVGDTEFLGIFNPDSSGQSIGSLLILPAPGSTAITPGVLPDLASKLSTKGWHTVGISLPSLDFSGPTPVFPEPSTKKQQAAKNEDAAKEEQPIAEKPAQLTEKSTLADSKTWFADQQNNNMAKLLERLLAIEPEMFISKGRYILLAQGVSAELVLELISSKAIRPAGLITLNLQHPEHNRAARIPATLAAVNIPILDIYNISNATLAAKRKLKQKSKNYRQLYIPSNDINFHGSESELVKRVQGWLQKTYSQ